MATTVPELTLTRAEVAVGSAARFRETINTNFSTYKTQLETQLNTKVKTAIDELQAKVGDWNTSTLGSITTFATSGWQASWPKTLSGFIGTNYPWSTYGSLTSILGTSWAKGTYGDIGTRLGGAKSGRRVFISYNATSGDVSAVRSLAVAGDLICEVYKV